MVLIENEHWAATAQTFNFRLYAKIGRTKLTPVKKNWLFMYKVTLSTQMTTL